MEHIIGQFKLHDLTNQSGYHVIIGIWKIKSYNKPPTNTYFIKGHTQKSGYGYLLNMRYMVSKCRGNYDYLLSGTKCKNGDIFDICLN